MALLNKGEKLIKRVIPGVPLRDLIVYPHMVVPLLVGRPRSLNAVEECLAQDSLLILCFQKDPQVEEPELADLYSIGVLAKVLQSAREPNGSMRILVECLERVKVKEVVKNRRYFACVAERLKQEFPSNKETEALARVATDLLDKYLKLNPSMPKELYGTVLTIEDHSKLCDTIAGYLPLKLKDKGRVLETLPISERLEALIDILNAEIGVLEVQKDIQDKVIKRIEESQKQYLLTEQLKTIQKELGREEESPEIVQLKEKIKKAGMPKTAEEKALEELTRLSKMMPLSPEATVSRTYLEWLTGLPWNVSTEDNLDVKHAARILDEDHYGLEKVKERIVEYLAVRKRTESLRGPILCFVGPPGVGKTSLGRSIARALGRKLVRVSLGGVRDEAEIRGHRRTYIGALPGRIIQSIKKAGVNNPVFLLDEIDKLGKDFRGDPASALLEVLDPEQNNSFSDHYLEVEFDLSRVLFITTANTEFTIPPALLDRMEIISLPGYTMWEKMEIAKRFLVPRQLKEHGLNENNLKVSDEALVAIIRNYTREAGVRNLEREIASICRKVTRKLVESNKDFLVRIGTRVLDRYLGPEKFTTQTVEEKGKVGVACGMAWTWYGGDILFTEIVTMAGTGELILTGQMGEVMRESAQAARSYVRANAVRLGIDPQFYKEFDIHVHVPEGAIPKDGPSAGVTIVTALVSALTRHPVDARVAMTGEITLQGKVLKIGGLKAKILAAHRAGIKKVLVPAENEKELEEIPKKIREELNIRLVRTVDDVLGESLMKIE
ncbi:MAG: endopeptidase La [Candidatus Omnitrophica bacterium]|nr:endopeptidase La [Candidatus Omnitrophota bacterium]